MPQNDVKNLFDNEDENDELEEVLPYTTWHNPTDVDVRLELHVATPTPHSGSGPGRAPRVTTREGVLNERTGKKLFIIKAHGDKVIPSEFDSAIQKVSDGVVMSGLAPQLVNKGLKNLPKVHPSLDAALQQTKAATKRAQDLMLEKAALIEAQASTQAEVALLRQQLKDQADERAKLEKQIAAKAAAKKSDDPKPSAT